MAGYILVGALSAWGVLCLLWAVLGWLLPDGKGIALVCLEEADPGIISRYGWLRGLGFLRCPLLVLSDRESEYRIDGLETIGPEDLTSRLQEERYGTNGTGNGDSSGRGERRGISEL